MDPRKYNIYFHTHTISGIFIAALLYVIFFAGSFSFSRMILPPGRKADRKRGTNLRRRTTISSIRFRNGMIFVAGISIFTCCARARELTWI